MTHAYRNRSPRRLAVLIATALAAMPLDASEIRSHPEARGENRPSIHEAGNGTPVVEITTPGADGVSHNVYRQLDVDERGVVFNNGRTTSATTLAGQIGANPALASGTADLILNEIRSASPSQLAGYLEIGGDPADLVIANPAGITCNGCGFINADRAMLTTGRPRFDEGRWTGLDVRDGRIRIEGDGMDASRTAEADLLARSIEINAGIWADRLDVTTGTGRFDRAGALVESMTPDTPAPAWSIDTARLGGMYANKIRLVANERGVGVNHAGEAITGSGGLELHADGRLVNRGNLRSGGPASIETSELVNQGLVQADDDIEIDSSGGLVNREGSIVTGGSLDLNARDVSNEGNIHAGKNLAIDSS
ncbi:filamentous hemagglutinin N-terminal domain-containing protein, partial [Guyparkeria sp.]|uniref:filamentous hemagglutinin N-terminal domain-containing protein n=2 Tax=Guyparkeria sp. TaxID=2035736 RepID=UPI0039704FE5